MFDRMAFVILESLFVGIGLKWVSFACTHTHCECVYHHHHIQTGARTQHRFVRTDIYTTEKKRRAKEGRVVRRNKTKEVLTNHIYCTQAQWADFGGQLCPGWVWEDRERDKIVETNKRKIGREKMRDQNGNKCKTGSIQKWLQWSEAELCHHRIACLWKGTTHTRPSRPRGAEGTGRCVVGYGGDMLGPNHVVVVNNNKYTTTTDRSSVVVCAAVGDNHLIILISHGDNY